MVVTEEREQETTMRDYEEELLEQYPQPEDCGEIDDAVEM